MELLQVWGGFGLLVLASAQSSFHRSDPPPSYLLLAPRVLRPGVPTSLSVSILGPSPVTVAARVVHGNQTLAKASSSVPGGSTRMLTLPAVDGVQAMDWEPYQLEVKGHVGGVPLFSNSTRLTFDPRGWLTLLQTDRTSYRPGQRVRVRALSLGADGRPQTGPLDLQIRDPRGNLLRQWLQEEGRLGVVSKEFQLSETPPLGRWTLSATLRGVSSTKEFSVAHYELPRFEVLISAPDVVHPEEPLEGLVSAKYTYGKPVVGHMNITFIHHFYGYEDAYSEDREIDGTEEFRFYVPDYHQTSEWMEPGHGDLEFLTVSVHVTEHLTGLRYNASKLVSLAKSKYKISFEDFPTILRPSLSFTGKVRVSRYDGGPLTPEDQKKTLGVSVVQQKKSPWGWTLGLEGGGLDTANSSGSWWSPTQETPPRDSQLPVPEDGGVPLRLEVMNATQVLTIHAYFEDCQETLQLYMSYASPSHTYLQIHKPATPAKVGSPLRLQIERNFPMTDVHYVVRSGGRLVAAGSSSGGLALVPEASWAPLFRVLAFCVRPGGEVVNAALELPVTHAPKNKVSLSWSRSQSRPGQDLSLELSVAEPGSLVGILVVDKAARLAGSQNDITKETVMRDMERFHGALDGSQTDVRGMGDPLSVFRTCGLEALTDAALHAIRKPVHLGEEVFDSDQSGEVVTARERRDFPETWIWMDVHTGDSDTESIPVRAPDSVTTWVASAFVVSEGLGLGVVEDPAELTVFQDFFLSLNAPALVVRGEELVLEVLLFNYLQQDQEVTVTVAESDSFRFVFPEDGGGVAGGVRRVYVAAGGGASALVPIRPLVLGEMTLSVSAAAPAAADRVTRTVLVKAEGLEQSFSSSLLLEPSASRMSVSRSLDFSFPPDVVEGSQRVSLAAVGDVLGPSIGGLGQLVQMPSGCGEQNMIHFAPNVYVLQYLSATGQDDPDTRRRATGYMLSGYERQLSFQRADGSFSAFGEQDASGSTWLTAFVLRCFLQARPFVAVGDGVMATAASWLSGRQGADGGFLEPGRVIHTELRGGQDGPASLTAYVLAALLEDAAVTAQYSAQVTAGLDYLEARLRGGVASSYSLGLLGYALALGGRGGAHTALSTLLGGAHSQDGVPAWAEAGGGGLAASWQPASGAIELASYALLALLRLDRAPEGRGLMSWLSQQRNHLGGFGSTQDTVVALQALSTFASLGTSRPPDVVVTATGSSVTTFYINQENHLLLQSQQIEPEKDLNLEVAAEGHGLVLFQLNVFYNVRNEALMRRRRREAGLDEAFHLYVELFDSEGNSAHLYVCTSLTPSLGLGGTGMALLEVGLLSGFSLEPGALQPHAELRRVETPPGKLVLYLDSVTTEETCLLIPLLVEFKVARVQEAAVIVYDYYEPRRRSSRMYGSRWRSSLASCSFCGDDCSRCRADGDSDSTFSSGARRPAACGTPALLLLLLLLFLLSFLM